jgi:hypothetical protein
VCMIACLRKFASVYRKSCASRSRERKRIVREPDATFFTHHRCPAGSDRSCDCDYPGRLFTWLSLRISVLPHVTAIAPVLPSPPPVPLPVPLPVNDQCCLTGHYSALYSALLQSSIFPRASWTNLPHGSEIASGSSSPIVFHTLPILSAPSSSPPPTVSIRI